MAPISKKRAILAISLAAGYIGGLVVMNVLDPKPALEMGTGERISVDPYSKETVAPAASITEYGRTMGELRMADMPYRDDYGTQ